MRKSILTVLTIIFICVATFAPYAGTTPVNADSSAPVEENLSEDEPSSQEPKITFMSFWTQNPFYFTLLVIIIIAVVSSYFFGLASAGIRLSKNSRSKDKKKDGKNS